MGDDFYGDKRYVKSPALQAALYSSSHEYLRRKYRQCPIYLPPEAGAATPLSMDRAIHHVKGAENENGYEYVCDVIYRTLKAGRSPHRELFEQTCGRQAAAGRAKSSVPEPLAPHIHVRFDPDKSITTVAVSSFFDHITYEEGKRIVGMAEPLNWANAAKHFFKGIEVGALQECDFVPSKEQKTPPSGVKYQIQEHVEWSWAPRVDATGGIINVLEIEETLTNNDDGKARGGHVTGILEDLLLEGIEEHGGADMDEAAKRQLVATNTELEATAKRLDAAKEEYAELPPDGDLQQHYAYRLVRCLQSKFVSVWSVGGLDLDDGTYWALWRPSRSDPEIGALFIKVVKDIRYTRQADVYPGYSKLLNLLSPAVVSMLLRQIAYDSVDDCLQKMRRKPPPAPPRTRLSD